MPRSSGSIIVDWNRHRYTIAGTLTFAPCAKLTFAYVTEKEAHIIYHVSSDAGRGTQRSFAAKGEQQFHCFCYKLYFYSAFKDFHTIAPAFRS